MVAGVSVHVSELESECVVVCDGSGPFQGTFGGKTLRLLFRDGEREEEERRDRLKMPREETQSFFNETQNRET